MVRNVMRSLLLFFFVFPSSANGDAEQLRQQARMLEQYENVETNALFDAIKNDLLSEYAPQQDAGCIILLKIIGRLKEDDPKAQLIVTRLSADGKVVGSAADILESRLLGWYNRDKPEETDDDIKLYAPLFYILGKADDKNSRGILVRSFLYLHDREDIFKGIPMSEELIAISLKRLKVIRDKLCCLYPGRDFVIGMLEKDSRLGMLDIIEDFLIAHTNLTEKMKKEIKEFTIECMEYGDSKNGFLIRIKAAKIAGILVKNGERDLARKIEDASKNDPYCVHKYDRKAGYSFTEWRYPVREICSKILATPIMR